MTAVPSIYGLFTFFFKNFKSMGKQKRFVQLIEGQFHILFLGLFKPSLIRTFFFVVRGALVFSQFPPSCANVFCHALNTRGVSGFFMGRRRVNDKR